MERKAENKVRRAYILVLDSFGIGAEPDAAEFGDSAECNTLGSVAASAKFQVPNMARLGLFNIDGVSCCEKAKVPEGSFGRMRERSRGKDTTIGHWELAGIVSEKPMPTYPQGFPPELVERLEQGFGRRILCNKPYSGTQVIHDYGQEHEKTGALIVYTSADSVLQIAAHEEVVPLKQLYEYCRIARKILTGKHSVGRVIARPFIGSYPNYERTPHRHDFSMLPPQPTILDAVQSCGLDTIGVGKISDIFAARGVGRHIGIESNTDGMEKTIATLGEDFHGLCFVNLVDFDMKYGHRRDVDGYAEALTVFDRQLTEFLAGMRADDVLFITADHGCDPGAAGTDHTREYVPLLACGQRIRKGVNIGTRPTFADLAATIADLLGAKLETQGQSFWPQLRK